MKRHLTFLLGGVAGLLTLTAAQAAPAAREVSPANSYAELLEPVPNATAALLADDLAQAQEQKPLLQLAQFRPHHHHHHHHHHHGFFPGAGVFLGAPSYAYGDCYWRLGRPYWNGWRWVRTRVRVCD